MDPMTRFRMFRSMFADLGTPILPHMKVLDFGCGEGRLLKAALDQGFDAYGCDLYDVKYSQDSEAVAALKETGRLRAIRMPYELPFDDATFDVVVSSEVFEHVLDYPQAIAELQRVMRPGGCFLHIFPSRYLPIEGHIFVPLASIFRPRWWLWLWALLGVRNSYQRGLSARAVVDRNAHFLAHGTNYPPARQIRHEFEKCFSKVAFVEHAFLPHSQRPRFLAKVPFGAALYGALWSRCLYGVRDPAEARARAPDADSVKERRPIERQQTSAREHAHP